MVKYNLKYTGKQDGDNHLLTLTKKESSKKPDMQQGSWEDSKVSLYDVFRVVRNILGVYVSVYILGRADKYLR